MGDRYINPFLNRQKVTDPKEFFGRSKEIASIIDRITHTEPQSVAVVGERRSGKSSLLTYLYQVLSKRDCLLWGKICGKIRNPEKFICILLDLEEVVTNNAKDFTWVIIDELISENPALYRYVQYYPAGADQKYMPMRNPQIILKNMLRDAGKDGYRFVFFIDEFELLSQDLRLQDAKYLQYLRGISDNYALAFVTSSRKPLTEISHKADPSGSPFDNNFSQPRHLGLLAKNECEELIDGILKSSEVERVTFSHEDVKRVIQLAGRHPYFIKIACSNLFEWVVKYGRREDIDWEENFKKEANEEFARMWAVLDNEEKDWIFAALQEKVGVHELSIYKSLKSLYERGMLQRDGDEGLLEVFSEGFSAYIKEFVKSLENAYEDIERQIGSGYLKLNHEEIQSTLDRLNNLKNEWENQEQEPVSDTKAYIKCKNMATIFKQFDALIHLIEDLGKKENAAIIRQKIDSVLKEMASAFQQDDWFNKEKDLAIDIHAGEKMLDWLVEYLELKSRNEIFGNGYDEILACRINFMKRHEIHNFSRFSERVEHAFNRLVEVYDYSKAYDILQMRNNRFIEFLAREFFRNPIIVVVSIILIPWMAALLITKSYNDPPWSKFIWLGVFCFYTYFIWIIHKPLLFEGCCLLPEAKKLYSKLIFWRIYLATVFGFIAFVGILSHTEFTTQATWILKHPWCFLSGAVIVGFVSLFVIALRVRPKTLDFNSALHRAAYFCSVEYLKAFWIILGLSMIGLWFFKVPVSTFLAKLSDGNESAPDWLKMNFGDYKSLGLPQVLAISILAPFVGMLDFFKSKQA